MSSGIVYLLLSLVSLLIPPGPYLIQHASQLDLSTTLVHFLQQFPNAPCIILFLAAMMELVLFLWFFWTMNTTTTTTTPASQRKAVVTLKRSYGTYTGVSLKVSYTVEGNKDLRCTTLSKILGEDFNGTRISYIYDIAQTTPEICTITVEYIGERDGDTREIILSAAPTFSITDTDGVVQTTLLGSPQSIWATRPAS